MSHFARIRAPGFWLNGTAIDPTELEAFDGNLFKAANFDDGGVWAPAATIVIGGSGLQVTGVATFAGTFHTGTATFVAANFDGDVSFNEDVFLGSGPTKFVTVLGTASFQEAVTFSEVVTFSLPVTFNADVSIDGAASLNVLGSAFLGSSAADVCNIASTTTFLGPVTLSEDVSITDPVTLSGDGHIRERATLGANADTTYNISTTDVLYVATGTLTAARIYTIANGTNGDRMRIFTKDSGFTVTIKRADTSTIAIMQDLSTQIDWIDIMVISGVWTLIGFYRIP